MKSKVVVYIVVLIITALFTSASAGPIAHRVNIQAKRFQFTPNEITVKQFEPVVLVFKSKDVTHGIEFKDLGLKAEIPKGQPTEVSFTPTTPGTYEGRCVHFCGRGHGGMKLTVHVVESK